MAGTTKTYDPLEGVTSKTTKDELMNRLRKAATSLKRQDRSKLTKIAEIEARLQAKRDAANAPEYELRQAIFTMTDPEWTETISFLEEFEDLAPVGVQRLIVGGRVLLGQIPVEPDPDPAP